MFFRGISSTALLLVLQTQLFTVLVAQRASAAITVSLPSEVVNFVPPCALPCFSSFVNANFGSSSCGRSPTLQCLCAHTGTNGFTLGEGALSCLAVESKAGQCQGADDTTDVSSKAYAMCAGETSAAPETHATLIATLVVPVQAEPATTSTRTSPPTVLPTTAAGPTTRPSTSPMQPPSSSVTNSPFQTTSSTGTGEATTRSGSTPSSGLTSAQIIGIGVGCGAALLLVLGVYLFIRVLRQRPSRDRVSPDSIPKLRDSSDYGPRQHYIPNISSDFQISAPMHLQPPRLPEPANVSGLSQGQTASQEVAPSRSENAEPALLFPPRTIGMPVPGRSLGPWKPPNPTTKNNASPVAASKIPNRPPRPYFPPPESQNGEILQRLISSPAPSDSRQNLRQPQRPYSGTVPSTPSSSGKPVPNIIVSPENRRPEPSMIAGAQNGGMQIPSMPNTSMQNVSVRNVSVRNVGVQIARDVNQRESALKPPSKLLQGASFITRDSVVTLFAEDGDEDSSTYDDRRDTRTDSKGASVRNTMWPRQIAGPATLPAPVGPANLLTENAVLTASPVEYATSSQPQRPAEGYLRWPPAAESDTGAAQSKRYGQQRPYVARNSTMPRQTVLASPIQLRGEGQSESQQPRYNAPYPPKTPEMLPPTIYSSSGRGRDDQGEYMSPSLIPRPLHFAAQRSLTSQYQQRNTQQARRDNPAPGRENRHTPTARPGPGTPDQHPMAASPPSMRRDRQDPFLDSRPFNAAASAASYSKTPESAYQQPRTQQRFRNEANYSQGLGDSFSSSADTMATLQATPMPNSESPDTTPSSNLSSIARKRLGSMHAARLNLADNSGSPRRQKPPQWQRAEGGQL